MDPRQQELIRNEHKMQYLGFGMVAFLFNLAPVVNYGLFYANVAGAALWAADIEARLPIPGSACLNQDVSLYSLHHLFPSASTIPSSLWVCVSPPIALSICL